MEEFNKKFNDLVKSLDLKIRPPEDAILIHYMESFYGEIRYQLRDKEPTNLKDAQKLATKIEKNMQASGKSNIPGFTRGTSSKFHEDKKKKPEIQESSNDSIKELTQLIKQMEINHVNQMTAMQNTLITMERLQANKFHPKHNEKWQKKPSSHEQRPPNTLESSNYVYHQGIPYCIPCGEFHDESNCQVFLQICKDEPYDS